MSCPIPPPPVITASRLGRVYLCPASLTAEAEAPELEPSPEAEAGIKLHELLMEWFRSRKRWPDDLPAEDKEVLEFCDRAVKLRMTDPEECRMFVEERMTCHLAGAELSGKPDLLFVCEDEAVVFDWKTGWSDVAPAWANLQLACLAVLSRAVHMVKTVTAVLVQPRLKLDTQTVFGEADLNEAEATISAIVEHALRKNPVFNPGPKQCKWCRARESCSAHRGMLATLLPAKELEPILDQPVDWPADRWARFLELEPLLRKWLEERRRQASEMLVTNPDSIPGWTIRQTERSEIVNFPALASRLSALGVSPEMLFEHTRMPLKSVHSILAGLGFKGKELSQTQAELLDGIVAKKPVNVLTRLKDDEPAES